MKDRELANTYVTEVENSELKLAVEQKEKSTPASNNQYTTGEEVKYEVTITNTGEKNLVDLELTDTLIRPDRTEGTPSGLPGGTTVIDRLEVNESKVVPITHTVEEKDLGGDLKNAVRVVGYAEDNPKESAEAESKVTVATVGSNENLEIAKEVISNPASPKGYMTGEEIIYKVTVKNKGKTTESNIIIDDEIKRLLQSGEEDPIEHWTFDTFYNVESGEETNQLGPGESGYRIYSYTVQQKDLGKTLINNAKIRGKNKVPPGEKPVNPDKPSGTIEITKSVSTEGIIEGHEQEVKSHAYTFTLNVTKNGAPVTDTLYYTDENNTRKTIQSGGTFTLKDKQKITITGIPDGADYRIKEEVYQIQNSGYYMESDKEEYTGTINLASSTEGLITIECTNKEVPGLEIVKEVVSKPKYKKDAYMVGETVEYQIKITNIGRVDIAVTEIILDDALKRLKANGEIDPIQNWTFDTLYEDKETTKPIAKTNTLKPEQVAYTKKYSYTIVSEDLGHTLINNVKIRKKLIPPGEKPVKPDVPTGTLTITKAYITDPYREDEDTFKIGESKFKITLRDQTGKELTEDKFPYYYGNVESGTITSGGIFTLNNGEGYTIAGLPDGTRFAVQEIEAPNGFNLDSEIKEGTIDLSKSLAESIGVINTEATLLPETGGGLAEVSFDGTNISGNIGNNMNIDSLTINVYKIATLDELGKPVPLEIYKNIKGIENLSKLSSSNLEVTRTIAYGLAPTFGKYIDENGIIPDISTTISKTERSAKKVSSREENGIYLIVCEDSYSMDGSEKYIALPFLVQIPTIEIETGDYIYDVAISIGSEKQLLYGNLEIVSELYSYDQKFGNATFAYDVQATKNGEVVYSNVVSTTFDKAEQKSIILERIPAGAEVTVTQIYSGGYNLVSDPQQNAIIIAEDVVSVSFSNDRLDNTNITSGSIKSIFKPNGNGGWTSNTEEQQINSKLKLNQNINNAQINTSITNNQESDIYVRLKVFAPSDVKVNSSAQNEKWTTGEDGYLHYSEIVNPGTSTAEILTKITNSEEILSKIAGGENDKEEFSIVVVAESVPASYDDDGNPYADWEAVNDSGNEGGA